MPSVAKVRKSQQLIQTLTGLLRRYPFRDLDLRRIHNDAKKAVEQMPDLYVPLGAVACLQGNDDDMRRYHMAAVNALRSDWAYFNFATSLMRRGFYSESCENYRKAAELSDFQDKHYAKTFLYFCATTGNVAMIRKYANKASETTANSVLAFISEVGVDDDELERINGRIVEIVHRVAPKAVLAPRVSLFAEDGTPYLFFNQHVAAEPAQVKEIETEVLKFLAQTEQSDAVHAHVVFGVSPWPNEVAGDTDASYPPGHP